MLSFVKLIKIVDYRKIRIRIVGVEGEHAHHLATTTEYLC